MSVLMIPFIGTLGSVAFLPLWAPAFWQKHAGKLLLSCPLMLAVLSAWEGSLLSFLQASRETLLRDYVPFLTLMTALYGIAGGIHVTVPQRTSPSINTAWLAGATVLAGWIGTTGASMVGIRPFLRLNAGRAHKAHLVAFFIFLVSNIGGGISPLGDPPLFMGFLQGIDFFWVPRHLSVPVLGLSSVLLGMFWGLDTFFWKRESHPPPIEVSERIRCLGKGNVWILMGAVACVVLAGQDLGTVSVLGVPLPVMGMVRDGGLLALLGVSLWKTPKSVRAHNTFEWEPIFEVAKIFFAIFLTILPLEEALHGGNTVLACGLQEMLGAEGEWSPLRCFWASGLLSSFLDNTPTYLFFFHLFGGDPSTLMTTQSSLLLAISSGSVFMGAVTYIGNAPNLMVASIARKRFPKQVPSFLGYMKWSLSLLFPVFALFSWILFL